MDITTPTHICCLTVAQAASYRFFNYQMTCKRNATVDLKFICEMFVLFTMKYNFHKFTNILPTEFVNKGDHPNFPCIPMV